MSDPQATAIEGKVAKIINSRELVINRGSDNGVQQGMRFQVIDEIHEIVDPDTRELLGQLQRVKVRVRTSEVYHRFSIARTYETYRVREPSGIDRATSPQFHRTVTRVRTIASSEIDDEGARSRVEIGDKVIQILED